VTTLETNGLTRSIQEQASGERRLVWDWPVRLFHWTLVAALTGAFVTNGLGVNYFVYHVWCGYTVIVLVAFRISWGLVGTRHARFSNFVHGPGGVLHYLSAIGRGRRTRYPGHNPLGALMVLMLLAALATEGGLGLFSNDEIFNVGPLSGLVSKSVSLQLTSLHRKAFYWIAALIALHIAAVLIHVCIRREGLIRAMLTGTKDAHTVSVDEAIDSSRGLVAFSIFVVITIGLATLLSMAPSVETDIAGF
jgi:cytochrome b